MAPGSTRTGEVGVDELARLQRLHDRLRAEAERARRADLLRALDDVKPVEAAEPIRACVVGETKRGKSTLLNALIGRPLLSPVGVDITTTCWVEVSYGESEGAEVILANPSSPNQPVRRSCRLDELERYVALGHVREPVIGVQVRIAAMALRDLVLVDTPGVGGLSPGHTTTTLAALRRADALLFVCDCGQPILAPELGFLVEAARRVPTVVVAATKRDINPDFERVVEETKQRIAATAGLGDVPVLTVAAPLADRAASVADADRSSRLRALSGIEPLLDTLHGYSRSGAELVRFENAARVLAEICRALVDRSDEVVAVLSGNTDRENQIGQEMADLKGEVGNGPRIAELVGDRLDLLRRRQHTAYDEVVESLRSRYRASIESSAASERAALASRMVGELGAAAVDALEDTARRCTAVVAFVMGQLGGADRWPMTSNTTPMRFEIGLPPPDRSSQRGSVDLVASAEMFAKLVEILAAPAVVMAVLTGPGVIAAGLALAAGAGLLKATESGESAHRAALVAWVDAAADQARATFRRELDERLKAGEAYVEQTLPRLLDARRTELARLADELAKIRSSSADLRAVLAERRASASALHGVEAEIEQLVAWAVAARRHRQRS